MHKPKGYSVLLKLKNGLLRKFTCSQAVTYSHQVIFERLYFCSENIIALFPKMFLYILKQTRGGIHQQIYQTTITKLSLCDKYWTRRKKDTINGCCSYSWQAIIQLNNSYRKLSQQLAVLICHPVNFNHATNNK